MHVDSASLVMLQGKQHAGLDPVAICADAARPEKAFFDDSQPYRRPVPAAASLDVSHRQAVSCYRRTVASRRCLCLFMLLSAMVEDSKIPLLQGLATLACCIVTSACCIATSASQMHSSSARARFFAQQHVGHVWLDLHSMPVGQAAVFVIHKLCMIQTALVE